MQSAGDIDILVRCHAAGHDFNQPSKAVPLAEIQEAFDVNVIAPAHLTQTYLNLPVPVGGTKTIIHMSSAAAHVAVPRQVGWRRTEQDGLLAHAGELTSPRNTPSRLGSGSSRTHLEGVLHRGRGRCDVSFLSPFPSSFPSSPLLTEGHDDCPLPSRSAADDMLFSIDSGIPAHAMAWEDITSGRPRTPPSGLASREAGFPLHGHLHGDVEERGGVLGAWDGTREPHAGRRPLSTWWKGWRGREADLECLTRVYRQTPTYVHSSVVELPISTPSAATACPPPAAAGAGRSRGYPDPWP